MKVHVCASYKRSPVGFQLGSFVYQKDITDNYYLSFDDSNSNVYKIFEQGFIAKAQGLMPNQEKYLLLIKGVEYTYENHEEFGKIVYINIAFEFDNIQEYSQFKSGFDSVYDNFDENMLGKDMADFVVPDKDESIFGLHIDGEKFNSFIDKVNGKAMAKTVNMDYFELVTRSSEKTDYTSKIKELFGVTFERQQDKVTNYTFSKKKHKQHTGNRRITIEHHWKKTPTALLKLIMIGIIGGVIIVLIGVAIYKYSRNSANTKNIDQSFNSSDYPAIL